MLVLTDAIGIDLNPAVLITTSTTLTPGHNASANQRRLSPAVLVTTSAIRLNASAAQHSRA